jgi:hypothetical protein
MHARTPGDADPPRCVVTPHARFLECQDRRRRMAAGTGAIEPERRSVADANRDAIQARAGYGHTRRSTDEPGHPGARSLTTGMRHVLYEHPVTHEFALIRLPDRFAEGDAVPILPDDRWFRTREEAVAALPELLNQDE